MESEDIEETSLDEEINEDEIMKDEDIAPPNLEDLEVEDNESGSNMSTKMIFDAFLSKVAKSNWVDWKMTLLSLSNIILLLQNRVKVFRKTHLSSWTFSSMTKSLEVFFLDLKDTNYFKRGFESSLISHCVL